MKKIAVIGQGYVGLPLAVAFAKHFPVIGYDINEKRIIELQKAIDNTKEVTEETLKSVLIKENPFCHSELAEESQTGLYCSSNVNDIREANIYIVTVPTPIDEFNAPDLKPLRGASTMLGKVLKKGDIVIYESTVFPGCTEEVCVPLLEQHSGLVFNQDFYVGYSPERINPGDKVNILETIVKVTSGSTPEIAIEIDKLYKTIIKAGTHLAPSIKVAEAAKVIENAQRDVNISFVNELALIFDRIGIDTHEVLEAAGTKFNFLKFKPGLVGGHCISVDPYYLAHKAIQLGYYPDVILSGRRVNDEIPIFIANKVVKLMIQKGINVSHSRVLLLGFAFKENCPDTRNTKVAKIYEELVSYGIQVEVYDPWVNSEEVQHEYGITCLSELPCHPECNTVISNEAEKSSSCHPELAEGSHKYEAVIVTIAHKDFDTLNVKDLIKNPGVVFDAKSVLDKEIIDSRL